VHTMVEKLDAGMVLAEYRVPITPADSQFDLSARAKELAGREVARLLSRLDTPEWPVPTSVDMSQKRYFKFPTPTDVAQLRARQSMFISMLLGGRIVYTGRDIHAAHLHAREQGLNDGHFDRFLGHFHDALKEVGIETDKVDKVTKLLETRRNAVLNP